jgi:hypothetical protein
MRFPIVVILLSLAVGCAPPPDLQLGEPLQVSVRYPLESTSITMGQALKCIVEVRDDGGNMVTDAEVRLTISDPSGEAEGHVDALIGSGDVYRSEGWTVPHRSEAGTWTVTAQASSRRAEGRASQTFVVKNSISEDLLEKYGFWVEDPAWGGIETQIVRELGDAQDGAIIWGGARPSQHIFPETWLEVRWRSGRFPLESSEQVRNFMLNELGNLGVTPLRELGEFRQVRFRQWDAWQGSVRGQYTRFDGQWVVFHAPEADRTYAIGTTFVQAPDPADLHAAVRGTFEVHPEVNANGKAPSPLPDLLPTPVLIGPALGTRFFGLANPIVLTWMPVRDLADDEFYRVKVDFDYTETNTSRYYATRSTEFTLPADLYATPNCGVFNWQVTLMRRTGAPEDSRIIGESLSYDSLRWYVEWRYPPGEEAPFDPRCPNPQT